ENRMILYDQFQILYFLYLITPYLHESMHRKTISFCKTHYGTPALRTTLHLYSNLNIKSPTKEINEALHFSNNFIHHYKKGTFYTDYKNILFNQRSTKTRSYQIVIESENLANIQFLKNLTGLSLSRIAELSLIYKLTIK